MHCESVHCAVLPGGVRTACCVPISWGSCQIARSSDTVTDHMGSAIGSILYDPTRPTTVVDVIVGPCRGEVWTDSSPWRRGPLVCRYEGGTGGIRIWVIQACQLRLPAPGRVIGCSGLGCNQALYRSATKSIPEQTVAVGVSTKPVAPLLCLVVGPLPGQSSPGVSLGGP